MAKFIAIKKDGGGTLNDGDQLFAVEGIVTVEAVNSTSTAIKYDGGLTATITYNDDFLFQPRVRDAINAALTANPGGVKARVQLPDGITVSGIVTA
jgi:hypothetical protein